MKLENSCILCFFSHPFYVPWGCLMQTHCDHSVTTQALQLKGTVFSLGPLTDRGNSRYEKESSGNVHVTSLH